MGEQRAAEFKPQPHGQIGMRKSGVYYCTDCGQNINSPGCRPTFDSLLNDPAQQLDTEGVVIASVLSEQERDRLRGEEGMSEKHSDEKDAPYRVDPKRERLHEPTGIYVRAKHGERWGIHDIAVLDTDSLFRFFRSRDGDILWVPHDLPPPSAPFMVEIDEDPKAEAAWLRSLGLDPETATRDDLLKVFDGDVIPPGSTADTARARVARDTIEEDA